MRALIQEVEREGIYWEELATGELQTLFTMPQDQNSGLKGETVSPASILVRVDLDKQEMEFLGLGMFLALALQQEVEELLFTELQNEVGELICLVTKKEEQLVLKVLTGSRTLGGKIERREKLEAIPQTVQLVRKGRQEELKLKGDVALGRVQGKVVKVLLKAEEDVEGFKVYYPEVQLETGENIPLFSVGEMSAVLVGQQASFKVYKFRGVRYCALIS